MGYLQIRRAPRGGARALLVVPPLVKYNAGPLLGPAMLVGAGRDAGHTVELLDLNQAWLRAELASDPLTASPSPFIGDHDRPSEVLRRAQSSFSAQCRRHLSVEVGAIDDDPALTLTCEHDALYTAAWSLAASSEGQWIQTQLAGQAAPQLVGVSVMYSGQVLWGLAVGIVARRLWPGVQVVWGGAHVTALAGEIAADARYGELIDGFVFGYAERSFVALLEAVARGDAPPWNRAGAGHVVQAEDDDAVVPRFSDLAAYDRARLTLPAQSSRGCAYGRCAFCTYPAVEGRARELPLGPTRAVVDQAEELRALVSFKDSLLVAPRLAAIASMIGGRVRWSACTKLNAALADPRAMRDLATGGCATLEFGLETLVPDAQRLIGKQQSIGLFCRVLDAACSAEISVVINYITGFPGVDAGEDGRWLDRVRAEFAARPGLIAKLEHNRFQLERRSPMGMAPELHGLQVTRRWPWASVMGWRPTAPVVPPELASTITVDSVNGAGGLQR